MDISENGLNFIINQEGIVLYVYDDFAPKRPWDGGQVKGTLTCCSGHTKAAAAHVDMSKGTIYTRAQCMEILHQDLAPTVAFVNKCVTVPLNQNQFDALVSFCFNVGGGNFQGSTVLKRVNAKLFAAVPGALAMWNKSKGKVLKGLVNRRKAEGELWDAPA